VEKFQSVVHDIKHVKSSAAMLLGAPIGGDQRIDEVLLAKLIELRRLSNRLSHLNAQDALFLLKNCFSIPKLTYTLRFTPCYTCQLLSEYDKEMRSTLQSILNIQLMNDAWEQGTLPVANGGIGIRKATQVALPAFLSSVAGTEPLVSELIPGRLHQWLAPMIRCSRLLSVSGVHESTLCQSSLRTAQLRRVGTSRW